MATQLRLVEALPDQQRTGATRAAGSRRQSRPAQGVARRSGSTSARRAVHWGEWKLDARTRRIGRQGIAAARQALEHTPVQEPLSRAS